MTKEPDAIQQDPQIIDAKPIPHLLPSPTKSNLDSQSKFRLILLIILVFLIVLILGISSYVIFFRDSDLPVTTSMTPTVALSPQVNPDANPTILPSDEPPTQITETTAVAASPPPSLQLSDEAKLDNVKQLWSTNNRTLAENNILQSYADRHLSWIMGSYLISDIQQNPAILYINRDTDIRRSAALGYEQPVEAIVLATDGTITLAILQQQLGATFGASVYDTYTTVAFASDRNFNSGWSYLVLLLSTEPDS